MASAINIKTSLAFVFIPFPLFMSYSGFWISIKAMHFILIQLYFLLFHFNAWDETIYSHIAVSDIFLSGGHWQMVSLIKNCRCLFGHESVTVSHTRARVNLHELEGNCLKQHCIYCWCYFMHSSA